MLQQNLGRYYEFESVEKVCAPFNNLINTIKKEQSLRDRRKISMVRWHRWEKLHDR